jgi:ABC-type polysaccharide/polyol phosphate export permease
MVKKVTKLLDSINKVYAFFRRDLKINFSYKLNLISSTISNFVWIFSMGIYGVITQSAQAPYMEAYGDMNVATFLIVGMILNRFLRQSQYDPQMIASPGNLERILLTPCSIPVFVLGSMTWQYFWSGFYLVLFMLMAAGAFGMNIFAADWFTFIVILLLGIFTLWGLGLIGSSVQMMTKQFNPINWLLSNFSFLFSGVLFSPEALLDVDPSGILHGIAWCFPHTYINHMARLAIVGKNLSDMLSPLIILLSMAITFFGIGYFTFKICLRRCQLEGSLGWV